MMADDRQQGGAACRAPARGLAAALPDRPAGHPAVSAFPLDDELILHDARSGAVFVLNRTAASVWPRCDGANTADALARALAATFGIAHAAALADVLDLLGDFARAGLLRDA